MVKLLIVDDHSPTRQKIRDLLSGSCEAIRECSTATDACYIANEFVPDWIIMSMNLPDIPGIAATSILLSQQRNARIVLITNAERAYLRRAAQEAGACAYIHRNQLGDLCQILSSHRSGESPLHSA